jgi:hypothetical protein
LFLKIQNCVQKNANCGRKIGATSQVQKDLILVALELANHVTFLNNKKMGPFCILLLTLMTGFCHSLTVLSPESVSGQEIRSTVSAKWFGPQEGFMINATATYALLSLAHSLPPPTHTPRRKKRALLFTRITFFVATPHQSAVTNVL